MRYLENRTLSLDIMLYFSDSGAANWETRLWTTHFTTVDDIKLKKHRRRTSHVQKVGSNVQSGDVNMSPACSFGDPVVEPDDMLETSAAKE